MAAVSVLNEPWDPLVNLGGSVAWSPPSAFVQSTRKYEPAENSVIRDTTLDNRILGPTKLLILVVQRPTLCHFLACPVFSLVTVLFCLKGVLVTAYFEGIRE